MNGLPWDCSWRYLENSSLKSDSRNSDLTSLASSGWRSAPNSPRSSDPRNRAVAIRFRAERFPYLRLKFPRCGRLQPTGSAPPLPAVPGFAAARREPSSAQCMSPRIPPGDAGMRRLQDFENRVEQTLPGRPPDWLQLRTRRRNLRGFWRWCWSCSPARPSSGAWRCRMSANAARSSGESSPSPAANKLARASR